MKKKQPSGIETDRVSEINCIQCHKVLDVGHLASFSEITCPACSTEQTVPAMFGSFILLDQLGAGGMGVIYRGRDNELGRYVAIKVMKKSLGEDPEFIKSFKHEARVAAALNHPNVVQIYSFSQFKGQPYIVMELVGGVGLDDIIASGEDIDETRALEIHLEVTEGLKAASDVGLVHGDVKPANILFGKNGEAKVVDFGLASFVGQQQEGEQVWGTPYYIAPEKARRKKVDYRSDIYSLGATLFHVLARRPPFDGPTPLDVVLARLNRPAPNVLDFREDVHSETANMVARMLEADPTMRYPSYPALLFDMREALNASRKFLTQSGTTAPTITSMTAEEPLVTRKKLRMIGAVLCVLLICGGSVGGWKLYQKHQARTAAEKAEKKSYSEAKQRCINIFERMNQVFPQIGKTSSGVDSIAEKANAISNSVKQAKYVTAGIIKEVESVRQNTKRAENILYTALEARETLYKTKDSKTARSLADKLDSLAITLEDLNQSITVSMTAARKALEEAAAMEKGALEEAKQERKKAEQERKAIDLEKKQKEQRRLALQKAKETKQLRQETIQRELDLIDKARAATVSLIAQRKFGEAATEFSKVLPSLSMDETRDYFKNVLDSYNAIVKLKSFLIRAIQKSPYRNGWMLGRRRRDIVQADSDNGLTISLGSFGTTVVSWEQATVIQLLRIAKYYVETMDLSESERADMLLSMALFCYESGDFKRAESCAALAYQMNPSLKADIDRMMPDMLSE